MTLTLEELNARVDHANEVGGGLYLSSLTSIPEGFNPTVGGSLDLSSLTRYERAKVNVRRARQQK